MSDKPEKKAPNFKEHIIRFVIVTVVLFIFNLFIVPDRWWFWFPMMLVAIVLIAKYLKYVLIDE